jgi:hypothetical protein
LNNHRISTTVSQKHWALLNKYSEIYHTQQKALELALESLEKSSDQSSQLSREEEAYIRVGREIKDTLFVSHKEFIKMLVETADMEQYKEYILSQKPEEFAFEYYYKKPLKACSLLELVEGMIINIRVQGSADEVNYADDGDHYTINITHNLGLNFSKMLVIRHESLFKSYGVKSESHFSEHSVFYKLYKNPK